MRKRVAALAVIVVAVVAVAGGCGNTDNELPTAPGVSRAEPTGTVNTTVPASTTTKG
jgi:hypothetical protein